MEMFHSSWPTMSASGEGDLNQRVLDNYYDARRLLEYIQEHEEIHLPESVMRFMTNTLSLGGDLIKTPMTESRQRLEEDRPEVLEETTQVKYEDFNIVRPTELRTPDARIGDYTVFLPDGQQQLQPEQIIQADPIRPGKEREILVRLRSRGRISQLRRLNNSAVRDEAEDARERASKVHSLLPLALTRIVVASQYRTSGDLRLTFRTPAEADVARRHCEWVKFICPSAELRR